MVLHHVGPQRLKEVHERARPLDMLRVLVLHVLDHAIRIKLCTVLHVADVGARCRLHGHPAGRRYAFAHGRQMVKEVTSAAILVTDLDHLLVRTLQRLQARLELG